MTAWVRDELILDGESMRMNTFPPLPVENGLVEDLWAWKNEDERAFDMFMKLPSCNPRGYVATWEICDDRFYLNEVRGQVYRMTQSEPVLADWYSGDLVVPQGEMIEWVNHGVGSRYEKYLVITIDKGHVVERKLLDELPRSRIEVELESLRKAEEARPRKFRPGLLSRLMGFWRR